MGVLDHFRTNKLTISRIANRAHTCNEWVSGVWVGQDLTESKNKSSKHVVTLKCENVHTESFISRVLPQPLSTISHPL